MFNCSKRLFVLGALTALAAASLSAQTNTIKSRSYAPTIGNSDVNVRIAAWAAARNNGSPRVDTALYTPWKLFNQSGELHRIAATAIRHPSNLSASYRAVIGGSTKAVGWLLSSANVTFTRTARALASDASMTVYIYGVPITVQANAGVTLRMDLDFIDYGSSSQGVAMAGFSESYAWGWASAGVGVPGFQVGVEFDLRLGHQKFDNYIGAWPHYLSTWALNYDFTPVRLFVRAFLQVIWKVYLTIVDASFGAVSLHPFIQ